MISTCRRQLAAPLGFPSEASTRIVIDIGYRNVEYGGSNVPLSEHEQRLLEQMERALMAEDPKFATSLRHGSSGADRRRIVGGVLGALAGMGLLIAGVSTSLPPLGVFGFIVMLAAVFLVVSGLRRGPAKKATDDSQTPPATDSATPKPAKGQSGFMARFEQRWQDRNRRDGRDS